jgi:hypothetical protein
MAPKTNVAIPPRESFVADEFEPSAPLPIVLEGFEVDWGLAVLAVTTAGVFPPVVAAEPECVADALLPDAEADLEADAEEADLDAEVEEPVPMETVEFPRGTAPPVLMEAAEPVSSL